MAALLGQGSKNFDAMTRDRSETRQDIKFFRYAARHDHAAPRVQCCAPLGAPHLSDDEARELERVFKALADRHRVKILNRLLAAGGEAVCVCDFEDLLGLKQSTVSYHLKQLLDAGIVEREKRGSFAYFSAHRRGARARAVAARGAGARRLTRKPRRTGALRAVGDGAVTVIVGG